MRQSVLLLCCLLSACVFNDEYPNDWPSIVSDASDCPNIGGTYRDIGESSYYLGERDETIDAPVSGPRLTHYFFEQEPTGDGSVTISQADANTIVVRVDDAQGSIASRVLARDDGDYSCEDGRIWLTGSYPIVDGGDYWFAFGGGHFQIGFSKAADNTLIGEHSSTEYVAVVIIPGVLTGTTYFRWNVAELPVPR